MAERGVGMAKDMLKKSKYTGKSIFEYLLAYKITPLIGLSCSPAQLLQSRELKSTITVNRKNQLKPEVKEAYKTIIKNKEKQKTWYDKNSNKREKAYFVGQSI